jgi:hypothetical protein
MILDKKKLVIGNQPHTCLFLALAPLAFKKKKKKRRKK